MTFALDGSASQEEVLGAVNYLLANLSPANYSNLQTGEIIDSGGQVIGYLYKYIYIKYADSFDGTTNFSNTPTNRLYYGIRNSDSSTESTNPADYVWVKVSGGFGTTKTLWYLTTGGRQILFQVDTSQPNPGWVQDGGGSIDLDFITSATSSPANFIVVRITNNSSAPTNAEVLGAIGRLPVSGDLCTINYNSGISSILYKYTTGWAPYIRYITSDLIVADSIVGSSIKAGTITGTNIAGTTITGSNIVGGTITADKLSASYIQVGGAAGDVNSGVTTISGGKITANSITSLGTVTAGELVIGSSPAISGSGMTGSGTHIYSDGKFATGNSSNSVVWDNSALYIKGNLQSNNFVSGSTGWQILNSGAAQFNDIVVSRNLLIASGTLSVYGTRTYMYGTTMTFKGATYYALDGDLWINTGINASSWGANTSTYVATAGLNANGITVYYPVGSPGVANFLVEVIDISFEWLWSGTPNIYIKVRLWATVTGGANSFALSYYAPGGIDWNLYKVT